MNYHGTTQLQYPDEAKYPTIDSIASENIPRVSVTEEYNRLLASPHMVSWQTGRCRVLQLHPKDA